MSTDVVEQFEAWLVDSAEQGVPEIVLVAVLRAYAATIEDLGYVPRSWGG